MINDLGLRDGIDADFERDARHFGSASIITVREAACPIPPGRGEVPFVSCPWCRATWAWNPQNSTRALDLWVVNVPLLHAARHCRSIAERDRADARVDVAAARLGAGS